MVSAASATSLIPRSSDLLASCPGYKASNVKTTESGLTADLKLGGKTCNVYGKDIADLKLQVTYETGKYHNHIPVCDHEHRVHHL